MSFFYTNSYLNFKKAVFKKKISKRIGNTIFDRFVRYVLVVVVMVDQRSGHWSNVDFVELYTKHGLLHKGITLFIPSRYATVKSVPSYADNKFY